VPLEKRVVEVLLNIKTFKQARIPEVKIVNCVKHEGFAESSWPCNENPAFIVEKIDNILCLVNIEVPFTAQHSEIGLSPL
jgi:hypothetical protein